MKFKTEDIVREEAGQILGLKNEPNVKAGVGQLTTFNQLGIKGKGKEKKPDGWYLPKDKGSIAIILETKNNKEDIGKGKWISEIKTNCQIAMDTGYAHVIGLLYNGYKTLGFKNNTPVDVPDELQKKEFYFRLFTDEGIDKERIYTLTARINNCLHSAFGIKNLYHRMIFTACALVAERYGARLKALKDREFSLLHGQILSTINKSLENDKRQNTKLQILEDVYSKIEMNYTENQDAINSFIDDVCEISNCVNSNEWRGEDVMGIFFNEFNRYKKKSEIGQVLTPEHITSFMYRLIGITENDYVGDFCCGSGGFLVKSMSNMMKAAGGYDTNKAREIRRNHLFGIEWDKEIYALACANMLIHKDGKTNLDRNDMRSEDACEWVKSKPITKVLMNPPYERKYGCMKIVENVLDSVKAGTECAFILPDKKLEKASKSVVKRILSKHRLTKIIKLPEPLFFGVGVVTSIFVFISGQPQNNQEIFGCYIEDDGLETIKNKGRHDIKNKWHKIEDYWIDSINKLRDTKYNTAQWIKPTEHLSYQTEEKPFEISEEDFRKTAMDYVCFQEGIHTKEFGEKLLNMVLYTSNISSDNSRVNIKFNKDNKHDN
mgnify:CR=1 FL=1